MLDHHCLKNLKKCCLNVPDEDSKHRQIISVVYHVHLTLKVDSGSCSCDCKNGISGLSLYPGINGSVDTPSRNMHNEHNFTRKSAFGCKLSAFTLHDHYHEHFHFNSYFACSCQNLYMCGYCSLHFFIFCSGKTVLSPLHLYKVWGKIVFTSNILNLKFINLFVISEKHELVTKQIHFTQKKMIALFLGIHYHIWIKEKSS